MTFYTRSVRTQHFLAHSAGNPINLCTCEIRMGMRGSLHYHLTRVRREGPPVPPPTLGRRLVKTTNL